MHYIIIYRFRLLSTKLLKIQKKNKVGFFCKINSTYLRELRMLSKGPRKVLKAWDWENDNKEKNIFGLYLQILCNVTN